MNSINESIQRLAYFFLKDKRYAYYDEFKKNITVSKQKMESIQNSLIKAIILHAYNHTKYYKTLLDSHDISVNDINNKEDLKKIPILTKSIIKKNVSQIISNDHYSKNLFEVTSGGSTGYQSVILKSPYFEQMGRAATLRNNLLVNWQPSDRAVWIWGAPYEHQAATNSLTSRIGILLNRRLLLNAYRYSQDNFPLWVEKIIKFKPKVIYGYASIILEFSKFLVENNKVEFPFVESVITTTETLKGRDLIEQAFKCKVFDQYGCREIPAVAIATKPEVMHIADDNVAVNVYNNGDIIITALHSFGFPLINYKLGDCANIINQSPDDADLPFTSLTLSIGRITDNLLNRQGDRISSSALSTYISTLKPAIIEHQVIQNNYSQFTVNCIPDTSFNMVEYKNILHKAFSEYFGPSVEIKVQLVEEIPIGKSGKKIMFKRMFERDK